jgi:hypothetical protein
VPFVSSWEGETMKKFLIAGAVVLFAGVAATVAAAAEHRAPKHAPARASMVATTPAHKEAAPKKHAPSKKHHARAHRTHRAK